MRASIILIFLLSGILNFYRNTRSYSPVSKKCIAESLAGNILIVNSFDAKSLKIRKNKRELFSELTDSLELYLSKGIKEETGNETIIIPGIIQGDTDRVVFSLIKEKQAIKSILIRSLEVYFKETGEKETTDSDGKPQTTTAYDLCARIEYIIYNKDERVKESKIESCNYFTSRSVNSGHFTIQFGPDIIGKRKYTYGIVEKNAKNYIREIASWLHGND
jgi:hypothetical protein